jgi:peptidoglycan/LPS O-acetylase OafA/YrhL
VAFPPFLLLYGKLTKGSGEWSGYVGAAVLFIAAITLLRTISGDTAEWGAQVRRVVVFRIDSIAYGFLLYLIVQRATFEWNARLRALALLLLAVTTAAVFLVNLGMLDSNAAWLRHIHPFMSAAFGMSTLLFFLSLNPLVQSRWMREVCTYLGHISYPTYLFHLVILYGLVRLVPQRDGVWQFPLYAAAVVLFTTIFFYGFEKPILASRPRYPRVATTGVVATHDPEQIAQA